MTFISEAVERRRSGRRVISRPVFLWLGTLLVALAAAAGCWVIREAAGRSGNDVLRQVSSEVYDQGMTAHALRGRSGAPFAVVAWRENTLNDLANVPGFVPGLPGPYQFSERAHRRAFHARLIQNLMKLGAKGIVFDVVFDSEMPEVDEYLAQAIKDHGNVVLAGLVEEGASGAGQGDMKNLILPNPTLAAAASGIGFAVLPKDSDQAVRSFIWTFKGIDPETVEETVYPSLGVAGAALAAERPPAEEAAAAATTGRFLGRPTQAEALGGDLRTRFLYRGSADEPFGPGSVIEYENVLRRGQDPAALEALRQRITDKVVFVGEIALLNQDIHRTPVYSPGAGGRVTNQMGGVVIQAQVARAAYEGAFARTAPRWQLFLLTVAVCLLVAVAAKMLPPLHAGSLAAVLMAGLYFLSIQLMGASGLFVDPITPAIGIILAVVGETGFMYVFERKERDAVRRQLRRHVGETVANKLTDDDWPTMSGEAREITLLFSDLQGFTSISENLSSAEICSLLNRYFGVILPIITQRGGTLDKMMGDGVMCYFGWPARTPDHAERAIRCALEMQEALDAWQRQPENAGLPQLRTRIGIHSGVATIGEIGGRLGPRDERVEFTVIGDVVNVASRLEAMNKEFGTTILVSEATRDLSGETAPMQPRGVVTVRGRREPMQVFSIEPATSGATGYRTAARSASLRLDQPGDSTESYQPPTPLQNELRRGDNYTCPHRPGRSSAGARNPWPRSIP